MRRAVELGPGVPITWLTYVQYLVQVKQLDRAKATVQAARKALPADRSNLALAQCFAMLGEIKEADARIQVALQSPACDLATIRVAVDLFMSLGRFDRVEPILDRLGNPTMGASSDDLAWAIRTRSQIRSTTGRLDDINAALALLEQNLKTNPASREDNRLKAVLLAMRTSGRADAIKILEPLGQSEPILQCLRAVYLGQALPIGTAR